MNCPKCGDYNPSGTLICGNCGCSLNKAPQDDVSLRIRNEVDGDNLAIAKRYAEALACYLKAVELGSTVVDYKIGDIYYNGVGVETNYSEAAKWYQKELSKSRPAVSAYENMSIMYRYGRGVEKDIDKSNELYKKAIERAKESLKFAMEYAGRDLAAIEAATLGRLYENGPEGIKSNGLALEYYEKAAEMNSQSAEVTKRLILAYEKLGLAYAKGVGRPVDHKKAARFLEVAINRTSTNGEVYFLAADLYHHGKGVDENDHIAKMYYRKAMERGYSQAEAGYKEIEEIQRKRKAELDATLARLDANKPDEKEEWRRRLTRTCPRCGRNSGHPIGEFEKKASIGFWGFGSRLWGKSYKCDVCDYRW